MTVSPPTPLPTVTPLEGKSFGAALTGVDLNSITPEEFAVLREALYTHKNVIIRNQPDLLPERKPAVTGVDDVRIVGRGTVPAGHYGSTEAKVLAVDSHEKFHKYPLKPEEVEKGDTRFFLPEPKNVSIRFDDETDTPPIVTRAGCTAFVDCVALYESLSEEDKAWVEHSYAEYAPNPFEWNKNVKLRSNGIGLDPSDVAKLADLNEIDASPEEAQILPLLWPNNVTGKSALMYQAPAIRKLHIRTSPDGPFTVLDDPVEVWEKLYKLERPFYTEDNILFAPLQEGDLAVWNNRAVKHSSVQFPESYGPRIAHQCHLASSTPQATPATFSAAPW
ncbi:hypothetical protein MNV49_004579 [Pseudohyphozyma bogoriensis]|nr:hypothetical protein MNV49_004579 [Pseudohyphozyma bogoriensis]